MPAPSPSPAPSASWRLNVRALAALSALLVAGLGVAVAAWAVQASRGRSILLTQAREIAAKPVDAEIRAREMMLAHMRFAIENRSVYGLVFGDALGEIEEDGVQALGAGYYGCFAAVVGELARAGRLRSPDPHLVSQTLWAGCHGLVALLIVKPEFGWRPIDELTEAMADTLMRGALNRAV